MPKTIRARLVLSTALAGVVFASYGSRTAHAGSCIENPLAPGNFECTGPASPADTTQILFGNTVTGTTDPGFGITTDAGPAIDISSNSGQSFTDLNASPIEGNTIGIRAENDGTGDITIQVTGTVTGVTGDGIFAANSEYGTDLTISVTKVSGEDRGISVVNSGNGDLSVTASGLVEGGSDDGIYALNYGADLTISAASVSGGDNGVYARNKGTGTGAMEITTSGAVTGVMGDGISAYNYTDGDVVISTAVVSGGEQGIHIRNFGSGDVNVTTTGPVSGDANRGITVANSNGGSISITATDTVVSNGYDGLFARVEPGGKDLTISVAGVIGGDAPDSDGIYARNDGTGEMSITTTGAVAAGSGNGIEAFNYNGGGFSLLATDTITSGMYDGVYARNRNGTSHLTISVADVSGGDDGIYAKNQGTGALVIIASGAVTGASGNGIDGRNYGTDLTITAASVSGYTDAIYAKNNGTGALSITATGPLTSTTRDGISARNAGADGTDLTIDVADITADRNGIYARNYGSGSLTISAGAVSAGAEGIFAKNEGTGDLAITASGPVTGADGLGIFAHNSVGDALTISAASVEGSEDGIYAVNNGSGVLSITTTGAVTGNGAGDDGIFTYNQGTDLKIDAADVMGGNNGITANNVGTGALTVAAGTVTGTSGNGVYAYNSMDGTDLTVSVAGALGGETGIDAKNYGDGALSITATGPVTGGNQVGIYGKNEGTHLTVVATDVEGATYGVVAVNEGTGAVSVTTTGMVTGTANDGIAAFNNDPSSTDLTINALGDVTGGYDGIIGNNYGTGALSITASGTTYGGGNNGIFAQNYGTDLTISAAAVTGAQDGVYVLNYNTGSINITTTGTVSGGTNGGITAKNVDPTTDSITISAASVTGRRYGILAGNEGSGSFTVTTTGTVTGTEYDGIRAINQGVDLTIVTAAVIGKYSAINADGSGSGAVSVTTNGDVTGTGNDSFGIDAFNGGTGLLSVTTANGTTVTAATNGIIVRSETSDALLEIASTVTGGSGTAIDATGIGGDTRLELQPGFDFGDDFVFANTDEDRDNRLGLGGSSGLGTFDLALLDDGDDTPEGQEQIFGFQPIFLKDGDANFILTGTNSLAFEEAKITGGILALDGADMVLADGVPLMIGPDGGLGAIGNQTLVGDVINQGAIVLSNGDGFEPIPGLDGTDDVLTVIGDYEAASDLFLDTFLNDGTVDITDMLIVGGNTSSTTRVTVTNDGGPGGLTGSGPTDGILVVSVGGVSGGDFVLANDVIAGIFGYDLNQADGQNWYLQSAFLDQAYIYESLPGGLQTIGAALSGQLVERVGVRSAVPSTVTDAAGNPVAGGGPVDTAIWGRVVGVSVDSEGDLDSTTGADFDQTIGFVQAGADLAVLRHDSGRLIVGALGHWGTSTLDANDAGGAQRGSADVDFYGGGLTATWYSAGGWYFDNVVQYTAYDIDISTTSRFSQTSTDGYGFTATHELGYRIPISATAALVPQAQITYQRIDFDDFTDPDGVRVSLDDGDSLVGRLGLAAENSWAVGGGLATGYAEINVLHEFMGDNAVVASGTTLSQDLGGTSVEFGLGGTVAFSDSVSLYAEVDYTIPFDNGVQGFQGLAGLRVNLNPVAPPPPAPVIAPVAETAFIVFFDWDRANLTPEANLVLDDVVVTANQGGYASVRLDGYTDLSGSPAYNLGLSERRANSVADGLIARGIAPDEIVIRAFGEENPLVPTPDGVREPQNRRVEIFLS